MIKSPINYNGNKYKLLPDILNLFPKNINVFYDVFGGSGVVSLNVEANKIIYNDIVFYIKDILEGIKCTNNFNEIINKIESIIQEYSLSKENKDGFLKLRNDYNNGQKDWITFYTLICYSFNTQYRFNNKHEYNSSFGKNNSYFSEHTKNKLFKSFCKLKEINISFQDKNFLDIDFSNLNKNDFVYLDPPYYGSVGNYNDGKRGFLGWDLNLENSLRNLCEYLNHNNIKFALSNNLSVNTTLEEWAKNNNFIIHELFYNYNNSSYNKIIKVQDKEVLITNY